MADFDDFATRLLEEAKRFLERAKESNGNKDATDAYLHASLLLSFSALEAHVNAIAEEFAIRGDLGIHELGVLKEQELRLEDGEFFLGNLKMYKLEDRYLFLHKRFSGKAVDTKVAWWSQYKIATKLRNKMTHPKEAHVITSKDLELALGAIIEMINELYLAIYKKPLPSHSWGLKTQLDF